jgi:hypothetical protein
MACAERQNAVDHAEWHHTHEDGQFVAHAKQEFL